MALDTVAARSKRRRLPSVDVPVTSDDQLRRSLESLKEHLRMYEGDSGAPKERFVTIKELELAGLIGTKVQNNFALIDSVLGEAVSANPQAAAVTINENTGSGADTLAALYDTNVAGAQAGSFLQLVGGLWTGTDIFGGINTWDALQTFNACLRVAGVDTGYVTFCHDNTDLNITSEATTDINLIGLNLDFELGQGIEWADVTYLGNTTSGVPGTVITDEFTDYRDTFSRYNTTSSTYVDATNHFVDVSTLTDGAKYFFYLGTGHCNTSSNTPNSGQRLRLTDDNGSTTMAGSEAEAGQTEAYGFAYNYAFTKTIAAAGDDIKMQIRSVGGAGDSESIGFGAFGFNLDTIGAANYYEASDTNVAYGTSVTDTGVSVTVPAGDWLVFVNASFNSLNASGNGDHFLGLKDGATNKELTSFDPEFGSPEKYIKGGCRMFPSHAGGTFEVTAHGSHTGTLGRVYIFALNMAAFEETYIDVTNTPLTNPTANADMTRSFTAPSDGDYICFGYVREYWGSSGSTGDQEIEISVNSGAYTSYAHSHRRGDMDNGRIIHMFVYPTAVLSLTANDTVDARLVVDTPAGSSAVERWEEYSMIIMRLETASTVVNTFYIGDESTGINRYDALEHDFYIGANQVLNIDGAGNLSIADNIPVLNSDETGAPTENAGIEVERGTSTNTTLRWNETLDRWEFTNDGTTYYAIVTAHTGEVTGETALSLDVSAITNQTDVEADPADDVAIHDDTDGTLKKTNLSSITDAGYF